jgi:deuterolysin
MLPVADVFDFATAGAGTFKFEPLVDLRVGGLEEEVASPAALAKVTVASQAIEVTVTGEIAKREEKRAVSVCSNASRKSFIDAR